MYALKYKQLRSVWSKKMSPLHSNITDEGNHCWVFIFFSSWPHAYISMYICKYIESFLKMGLIPYSLSFYLLFNTLSWTSIGLHHRFWQLHNILPDDEELFPATNNAAADIFLHGSSWAGVWISQTPSQERDCYIVGYAGFLVSLRAVRLLYKKTSLVPAPTS